VAAQCCPDSVAGVCWAALYSWRRACLESTVFDAVNNSPTILGYSGEQIAHWASGIIVGWIALLTGWNFWLGPAGAGLEAVVYLNCRCKGGSSSPREFGGAFLTSALLWAEATDRSACFLCF